MAKCCRIKQNIVWTQRSTFAVEVPPHLCWNEAAVNKLQALHEFRCINVHQHASACINMQQHDPKLASICINNHQRASKINNMHPQKRMYTSTSCWTSLSSSQGTAWPLHPTRRRGLLRQSALLTAVQNTEAKRHTNSNKLTKPRTQQNAKQKPSQCSQCSSERLPVTTR